MITLTYRITEKDDKSVLVKKEVTEDDATLNEKISATTIIDTFTEALEKKQKTKKSKKKEG